MNNKNTFFDNVIKSKKIRDNMTSKTELLVIECLKSLGFRENRSFFSQYVFEPFILDIAFVKEKIAIEVDGKRHREKKCIEKDDERDDFLRDNGWVVIRVINKKFIENPSMYRFLIKDVVEYRRKNKH